VFIAFIDRITTGLVAKYRRLVGYSRERKKLGPVDFENGPLNTVLLLLQHRRRYESRDSRDSFCSKIRDDLRPRSGIEGPPRRCCGLHGRNARIGSSELEYEFAAPE